MIEAPPSAIRLFHAHAAAVISLNGASYMVRPAALDAVTESITEPWIFEGFIAEHRFLAVFSEDSVFRLFELSFPFATWADVPPDLQSAAIEAAFEAAAGDFPGKPLADISVRLASFGKAGSAAGGHAFAVLAGNEEIPFLLSVPRYMDALMANALRRWPRSAEPPSMPLPVRFCIGTGTLSPSDLADLEEGDAIEVDEGESAESGIFIIVGERLWMRMPSDAKTSMDVSRLSGIMPEKIRRLLLADDNELLFQPPADDFGEMQLTLVFELARKQMTLRELEALSPGEVISLAEEGDVTIIHGGSVIGKGELISMGSRRGVRVRKIAGR